MSIDWKEELLLNFLENAIVCTTTAKKEKSGIICGS
jgi:hypothetical protein